MAIFSSVDARRAVERGFDDAVGFLADLVRIPSLLGEEEPAQQLVEARLRRLGFEVESVVPDPERLAERPDSGLHRLSFRCAADTPQLTAAPTLHLSPRPLLPDPSPPSEAELATFTKVRDDADVLRLYNNIFFGNTASGGGAADFFVDNNNNGAGGFSAVTLQDNDFNQSTSGFLITQPGFVVPASNLNNVNPLFVNAAGGDYHLQSGSPCRDTGNNAAPALPPLDHDFMPRLVGGTELAA